MSDKNHWKSLANDIGAEIPDERYEPPPPVERTAEPPPAAESPRSRPKRQPAAVPQKGHWNQLASELGIESVEPELTPPVAEEDAQVPATPEPWALPAATVDASTPHVASELPVDESSDQVVLDGEIAADYDNDPLVVRHEPFVEEVATAIDIDGDESGQPEEDAEEDADEPRRRRRRRRGGRRRRKDADAADTSEADASEADASEADTAEDDTAEDGLDADLDATEIGEDTSTPAVSDELESGDEPRRRRRRRRRGAGGGEDEQLQQTEEAEVDSDASPEQPQPDAEGRTRAKHKKFPSWSEAIGMIVSNNLNSREKNSSGRGGRRRG